MSEKRVLMLSVGAFSALAIRSTVLSYNLRRLWYALPYQSRPVYTVDSNTVLNRFYYYLSPIDARI